MMFSFNTAGGADWPLLAAITGSGNRGRVRETLTVFLSRGGGRTWPVSKLVHQGPAAYSDLCVLDGDTVLCIFEGGTKNRYKSIRMACFDRQWLTK